MFRTLSNLAIFVLFIGSIIGGIGIFCNMSSGRQENNQEFLSILRPGMVVSAVDREILGNGRNGMWTIYASKDMRETDGKTVTHVGRDYIVLKDPPKEGFKRFSTWIPLHSIVQIHDMR